MPTDVSAAAGPVRLAVGANGEPRLLLPLTSRETPASVDAGNALSVSVSSFSYKGTRLRFLDLVCVREDLETVFAEVVDEILARIGGGDGTIRDFRSLLTRARTKDVRIGRVAGLVAELLVLNRLLDRSPSAWRAWRGPEGDRHDFRVGDTSLEVKASLRAGTSGVTINGLDQLEAPTGGTLYLLHIVLEPVTGGILSLGSLAQSAMSKVPEPARIETLLAAAGCGESAQIPARIGATLRDPRRVSPAYAHHAQGQFRTPRCSRCQLHDRSVRCHEVPVRRDHVS